MPDIAGLKLIVPTSVAGSGVSVSATGKVTFTAASSVSVNGCFTSTYDNYVVVTRGKSSDDSDIQYRLRVSGSDASGSNYARQRIIADNTSISGARVTAQTIASVLAFHTTESGGHAYFYGPALAASTAVRGVSAHATVIYEYASTHSLSTAYDGFTFSPAGGTITGTLTIYGLSQ